MPGEEQEDIVMTSTQNILLNITCPLSGKPVIELSDPVRRFDLYHLIHIYHFIYTQFPISTMNYVFV